MRTKNLVSVLTILGVLCFFTFSFAQVPQLINYQGVLTDPATGTGLTGSYSMTFSIYSNSTGGTALWHETQNITTQDGLFNVLLGSVTAIPLTLFDGADKYLGLKVGTDAEMTPRKKLVSVGYALRSYNADKVDGKDALDLVQKVDGVSTDNSGNIDLVAGANVTITPDNENNKITIAAAGSGGGDNLGDHTATQNVKLNNHWLSGDGGNEGVFVNNSGKVGIGTNNPINPLHIKSQGPWIRFEDSDGGHLWLMGAHGGNYFTVSEVISGTGYYRITIKEGGNVGIGTINPSYTLDVNGLAQMTGIKLPTGAGSGKVLTSDASGNGTWQMTTGADNLGNHTATQNIKLNGHWLSGDGGHEGIHIKNDGNVGIGTTNPVAKLDVNGAISGFGIVPIGSIIAWHKSFTGTPSLPDGWVVCSGQIISDSESPYNGQRIPNLNGEGRFLRGGITSGINQNDEIRQHNHFTHAYGAISGSFYLSNNNGAYSGGGTHQFGFSNSVDTDLKTGDTGGGETRPVNMSVVWIMRIK